MFMLVRLVSCMLIYSSFLCMATLFYFATEILFSVTNRPTPTRNYSRRNAKKREWEAKQDGNVFSVWHWQTWSSNDLMTVMLQWLGGQGLRIWDVIEQWWVGPNNLMNDQGISHHHVGSGQGHLGTDMVAVWTFSHWSVWVDWVVVYVLIKSWKRDNASTDS